ncbi:Na+/H+ antiporter subunit E [Bosea sp. (in: a-proteobacteria)]|uniref:Na+/H+ antiporter subunit E n=1 Tax=Bosea sp. (in: a-proteobacteria) TaxID=1871050 RepID=UPI0027330703|nr:Na+/H+ antiporter subunit E [Bosea sp. (in: a-proteobacteria)]MDP3257004.1 Na+/H+ antiporter subunit E [Bosea sp. (in: a-proteobacteria)]
MTAPAPLRQTLLRPSLLGRGLLFFVLWLVLIGAAPKDWPVGLIAAAAATWASFSLWPPDSRLSPSGLLRFVLRFVPQAVVAGLDVAGRAFARRIAMTPGIVTYRAGLRPGMAQGALCAVMSLQPGKLPVSCAASGEMRVHCLDSDGPASTELAADEAAFLRILPGDRSDA